jgi:hypothetical protein
MGSDLSGITLTLWLHGTTLSGLVVTTCVNAVAWLATRIIRAESIMDERQLSITRLHQLPGCCEMGVFQQLRLEKTLSSTGW